MNRPVQSSGQHSQNDGRQGSAQDFGFITTQRGMFSFSGLTKAQVHVLRDEHSIYMVDSGRISVAGLNAGNLEKVCAAVADVL